MEKEILKLLAILTEDNLYRQVYARQVKLLFDMLEREQLIYCRKESTPATNIEPKHKIK